MIHPCMFCGHKASATESCIATDDGEIDGWCIECSHCHACGPLVTDLDLAIEEWNECPRTCDGCGEPAVDLKPVIDPRGQIEAWNCKACFEAEPEFDYHAESSAAADAVERLQRTLREAGR